MAMIRLNTEAAVILLFLPLFFSNVAGIFPHGGIASPPATIFNVLHYGAVPNCKKDSTEGFMQAWVAACHWNGNARVLIPEGEFLINPVIFQGPCNSDTIVVEVKGTVKGSTDISEYQDPEWILFENIHGLVLTGGGTFDGQGSSVWEYNDCKTNPDCTLLAAALKFSNVTKGVVRRINTVNPQGFHIMVYNCNDLKFINLHITAPKTSPNTDGIHISSSNNVRIYRNKISTGDDCVSVGQGSTNVTISNVTCGPGHGISIGSLGKTPEDKDVRDVTVMNCTLTGTENGVRIKTWPNSPPIKASNFIFQDIIMDNVKNPIIIDQNYCGGAACSGEPSKVAISDVHFRNVHGTSSSNVAVNVGCSPMAPCQNIDMFNIDLKYSGPPGAQASSTCTNAKIGFSGTQNPPPCKSVA